MKLCFISKYPPIEGGISSSTYWLAKALGKKGHEVHIVTNALEVEDIYREELDQKDPNYAPKNVYVHSTDPSPKANPSHIPFSKAYAEKLSNLAIEVIEEYNLQLIDSWYVLPYVISGFIAKTITRKSQVMRHGGSDIRRLLPSPYLNTLFKSIFEKVDAIITNPEMKERFLNLGIPESKLIIEQRVPIDLTAFNPDVEPFDLSKYTDKDIENLPIITYIGKITYWSKTKGVYELLEACQNIKDEFLLLFVANGKKLKKFQIAVREKNLEDRVLFLNFVPPWQVPSIIRRSTCVVALEKEDSPTIAYHTPNLPAEVMATGKCLVLSMQLYNKEPYKNLVDGESVLVVNPNDVEQLRKTLKKVIKNSEEAEKIGLEACKVSEKIEKFDEYIDRTIQLYKRVMNLGAVE
jgi:glycosyltransferase involved in cell wall biosynthesis